MPDAARKALPTILEEIRQLLAQFSSSIPDLIDAPLEYVLRVGKDRNEVDAQQPVSGGFLWPPGLFHLLQLLQDGFASRLMDVPDDIRLSVGKIVLSATENGTLSDKKWALEITGIAPDPVLAYILQNAYASKSQWLKEVAYRQVARLSTISPEIAQGIRDAILKICRNWPFTPGKICNKDSPGTYQSIKGLSFSDATPVIAPHV